MAEKTETDKLSKQDYKRRLAELQPRVFELTRDAYHARVPVAVVLEGWAASGKGTSLGDLAAHMDPRGMRVAVVTPPRTADRSYPWMRRFWLQVPSYGQTVVFDASWYRRVLIERVTRAIPKRDWQRAYQDILEFEQQLSADSTLFIKLWLHISRKEQARRFKKLLADELTAWQVSEEDLAQHEAYKKYNAAVEEMLAVTDTPHAPWTIVDANDRRAAAIKVLETVCGALGRHLEALKAASAAMTPTTGAAVPSGGLALAVEAEANHA